MLSGVLVARLLGVEDRGHLALLVLVPTVLSQIGGLGLPLAATFHIARAPGATRAIMRSLWVPALAQAVALTFVHAVILLFVLAGEAPRVQLGGALSLGLVPGLLAYEYGQGFLQGQRRFRSFNVLRLLPQALYSLAVLALFLASRDSLPIVVSAWVLSVTALGAAAVVIAARGASNATAEPSRPARACGSTRRWSGCS